MRLHLLRHGETDINAAGRLQGSTNSLLTERGRRQARELAVASLAWNPTAIYSSPLQRALDVATRISDMTGVEVCDEPRITEMDMGALEGVTIQQMRDGWPDLYQGWRQDASSVTMPNGESLGDVQERAMAAVADIDDHHGADDTVIAVTHKLHHSLHCRRGSGLATGQYQSHGPRAVQPHHHHHRAQGKASQRIQCRGTSDPGQPHRILGRRYAAPPKPTTPGDSAGGVTRRRKRSSDWVDAGRPGRRRRIRRP